MKRCSVWLGKKQIQTSLRCILTCTRMEEIEHWVNSAPSRGSGLGHGKLTLLARRWNATTTGKNSFNSFLKLNLHILYDRPVYSWVFTYEGKKHYVHTNKCPQIFMAALFVIAKSWKITWICVDGGMDEQTAEQSVLICEFCYQLTSVSNPKSVLAGMHGSAEPWEIGSQTRWYSVTSFRAHTRNRLFFAI